MTANGPIVPLCLRTLTALMENVIAWVPLRFALPAGPLEMFVADASS